MAFRTAASRRAGAGILGKLAVLTAAALAMGQPAPVLAATPVMHVMATAAMAAPGTNLLLNPEATAGATSAQGWDAVTIPGWQVAGGLPTVVRYGTPGFRKPPNPGRPTAAISSPAALAVPQNSFSRRPSRRMRATTSLAGSAAPRPAPRNSPFSSREQAGEFWPPSRSGLPGNRRSPRSITGKRPARSRGRGAGPGDDHPDDHPHRLEWTRRAADRI
jgi:hypothetical protein